MSNNFTLTLDTTGPASPTIALSGGSAYATAQLINATIGTTDSNTTGYQVKIWGDVDTSYNASIQATEEASSWITFATTQQLKLSAGDGLKNVYLKIRDDVYNVSSQVSAAITLDTTIPTVTISSGPDVTRISTQTGKNACNFSFQADVEFQQYSVRVVSSSGSAYNTGTEIPITAGSSNMGATGTFTANTNINCVINGADLQAASSGDGNKVIKVFVQDQAGNWSA